MQAQRSPRASRPTRGLKPAWSGLNFSATSGPRRDPFRRRLDLREEIDRVVEADEAEVAQADAVRLEDLAIREAREPGGRMDLEERKRVPGPRLRESRHRPASPWLALPRVYELLVRHAGDDAGRALEQEV